MSYVRWGVDGSHVYLFDHMYLGNVCWDCCLCTNTPDGHSFQAGPDGEDLDAMLAHLAEHRAAGHVVPDWVDEVLRDEWNEGGRVNMTRADCVDEITDVEERTEVCR